MSSRCIELSSSEFLETLNHDKLNKVFEIFDKGDKVEGVVTLTYALVDAIIQLGRYEAALNAETIAKLLPGIAHEMTKSETNN